MNQVNMLRLPRRGVVTQLLVAESAPQVRPSCLLLSSGVNRQCTPKAHQEEAGPHCALLTLLIATMQQRVLVAE